MTRTRSITALWVLLVAVIVCSAFQPNLIRQAITTDWSFLPATSAALLSAS